MARYCTITTIDNPYDPFTDFDRWYVEDVVNGYRTWSKIARLTNTADSMTEEEYVDEVERAIDILIANDFMNVYRKVFIDSEHIGTKLKQ